MVEADDLPGQEGGAPIGAANADAVSRESGGSLPRGRLLAVLLAGALLQRRGVKIRRGEGETYPRAVLRVLEGLEEDVLAALRIEVGFLVGTDLRYGPFSSLAKHQTEEFAAAKTPASLEQR